MSLWPKPILQERANDLGWLALSPIEDAEVRIGVEGKTADEAIATYEQYRAFWWGHMHPVDEVHQDAAD